MTGAAPTIRASRTPCTPRPPAPQIPTACAGRTAPVSTMAAYGVETASGMTAAWSKGRPSRMAIRVSSRATAYWAQPPSWVLAARERLPARGAAQTATAPAARLPRLQHHPRTRHPFPRHLRAHGMNDTANLMPEGDSTRLREGLDGERRPDTAVDQMNIRQTHPCGPHLDQSPRTGGVGTGTSSTANRIRPRPDGPSVRRQRPAGRAPRGRAVRHASGGRARLTSPCGTRCRSCRCSRSPRCRPGRP